MNCAVRKTIDQAIVAAWVLCRPGPFGRVAWAVHPGLGVASVICRDALSRISSGSRRPPAPRGRLRLRSNPGDGATPRVAMTPSKIARLVFCEESKSIRTFRGTKVIVGRPNGPTRFDSCHLLEVEKCIHC